MKKTWFACWMLLMLFALHGCSRGVSNGGLNGGASQGSDLEWAQTAFKAMANGDASAEQHIDWDRFQSVGVNVGTQYAALPDETQKAAFRKSFLASFSSSFRATGASADSLSNWRVQSQDASQTIVAADTLKKTVFLITISHPGGTRKVTALDFGRE